MPRQKRQKPKPRSKLVDSIYLLLAALGIVAVICGIIAFSIAYDDAPWMPHGDRAMQLFAAVFGIGFGIAYLYNALQSRRLQRALADEPYLQPLAALISRWWISMAISLIGFGVGIYSLSVFLGIASVRAIAIPALVQIFAGAVLVVGGLTMVAITFKVQKQAGLTTSLVAFGFLLPAVLVLSGRGRLVVGCRRFFQ